MIHNWGGRQEGVMAFCISFRFLFTLHTYDIQIPHITTICTTILVSKYNLVSLISSSSPSLPAATCASSPSHSCSLPFSDLKSMAPHLSLSRVLFSSLLGADVLPRRIQGTLCGTVRQVHRRHSHAQRLCWAGDWTEQAHQSSRLYVY